MIFVGLRLKELRKQKNLPAHAVAEAVGVKRRVYVHYEAESRKPSFDVLIKLADFFDVSLDYLVGRSDNPERV